MDTEREIPWEKKDPRVVWRGKIKMAQLRSELVRISEGKSWSDVKAVVINDDKDVHTKDVMNLRDFCGYVYLSEAHVIWFTETYSYKFTVQTEGTSYSGRLKFLQLVRNLRCKHLSYTCTLCLLYFR